MEGIRSQPVTASIIGSNDSCEKPTEGYIYKHKFYKKNDESRRDGTKQTNWTDLLPNLSWNKVE